MNNARETERERETRGTIYYTCSSLVSLLACIAHNCLNTWNYIWKKKRRKKKHGGVSFSKEKGCYVLVMQEFISLTCQLIYISLILETKKVECPSNP